MKTLLNKFNQKKFLLNIINEVTVDLIIIAIGICIGYFIKTMY